MLKITDEGDWRVEWEVSTSLPSDFIHFLHHLSTYQNLVFYPNFYYIPLPPCSSPLLPNHQPPSCPVHPHLLPSLSLSPSLPSILHSLRQTIKQAFPWLTCNSPLPPRHPKPQTEGELQPGSNVVQNGPESWARFGSRRAFSAPMAGLLCSALRWWGHTDSRHAHTTHITVPSKEIPLGSGGIKDARLREKREECWNEGKRKSCFTERDLRLDLGQSESSHMCPFSRKKQSEFWHSSNSSHVLLSAFLTTLIWHSHIADLSICHLASRNYSSCESDVTERKLSAPLLPGSSARGEAPVSK